MSSISPASSHINSGVQPDVADTGCRPTPASSRQARLSSSRGSSSRTRRITLCVAVVAASSTALRCRKQGPISSNAHSGGHSASASVSCPDGGSACSRAVAWSALPTAADSEACTSSRPAARSAASRGHASSMCGTSSTAADRHRRQVRWFRGSRAT